METEVMTSEEAGFPVDGAMLDVSVIEMKS